MNPELRRYRDCPVPHADAIAIVALVNATWPTRSRTIAELAETLADSVPADRPMRKILTLWEARIVAHATTFLRTNRLSKYSTKQHWPRGRTPNGFRPRGHDAVQ